MAGKRRFSAEEKVKILQEVQQRDKTLSSIAEAYGVHPNLILNWRKQLFEGAISTFTVKRPDIREQALQKQVEQMEQVISEKDSIIATLVQENLGLKKNYSGRK